jgi:glycine/D-amino acid oxidase-like deaminating enzyme
MNLFSQQPYFLMKDGIVSSYNSINENIRIDVAIIGAGISGAVAAYYLRNAGLSIAVFERRHAGTGSTAASTSFLQYEIDTPLTKLSGSIGREKAVRAYQLCKEAIYSIDKICKTLKPESDFHMRPSLQYASYKKHEDDLYKEFDLRVTTGFDVDWLEQKDLLEKFGIDATGGILSADGGEVDAYMLTHALLSASHKNGHTVYTNTDISQIENSKRGLIMKTDNGFSIKAKKLIIACGYESLKYIPKTVAKIHSTYAIVSEPVPEKSLWYQNSLVWETASPYLYFRKTNNNRILVGGKDDPFHHPVIAESTIKRKALMLEGAFNKRMTRVSIKADYCWGGAFAITRDGLPYIGSIPERKNTFFALGYGGNGITFSYIAAEIIRDLLTGKKNENASLFGFNR